MVESEQKKKWQFKTLYASDIFNTKSMGNVYRTQAETAAKSCEMSWKEVLKMTHKELLEFITAYSESAGITEFAQYGPLGKE